MKRYNYIYLITNKINGKIYIGKHSTDYLDDNYNGSGKRLHYAYKKYGIENFTKEYLGFCDNEDTLNYLERFYIRKYKAQDPNIGYNLTAGGDGTLGRKLTEESRQKISESNKRKHFGKLNISEETRQQMSERSRYNALHISEETRQKRSKAFKGRKLSEEWKQKISEAHKGRPAYNKGTKVEKLKWITPSGEIKEMDINNVKRWHKDWILYEVDKSGVKFYIE